ncbi:molecular chaperone EcpD [Pseudomonas fluorescens]|uniref:Molecular chaperone EcpD n=1 Tax=Pseudomonas fluorescens TaxID=294 RepID=A0A1T2Y215_PSEFL|nr:fimbria/pilus periplasmic chaperone [Pseudomonas fluorescens]OPA86083.1 molecular chaperone EcpD [Pseudomonas fluorescens]
MQGQKAWFRYAVFMAALLGCSQAMSSVVITGTRVVYPADKKEVTVKINNEGTQPVLVQSWIDEGDAASTPSNSSAPFVISPPVSRVDPAKGQSLRLMFTGASLPGDKESVFWLNVLEIPVKAAADDDQNMLQMAFRSRIKLFYRPANLPGTPTASIEALQWKVVAQQNGTFALQAFNPTAFHVSQSDLTLVAGGQRVSSESGMVAPGQTQLFALPDMKSMPAAGAQVEYSAINDYGALVPVRKPVTP